MRSIRWPVAALVLASALSAHANTLTYRNATADAGLADVKIAGGFWFGTAVAFVDLDNDTWPDLYFGASAGKQDILCLNTKDGRFACSPVGPVRKTIALAIAAADYDDDGDTDLYVMSSTVSNLLENDGAAHFTDVTAARKVAGNGNSTPSGTWFDYDGDGLLDLFLAHGDGGLDATPFDPEVLRQNADGTFSAVTQMTGLTKGKNTLAMLAFDYDGDMRQDVLVTGNFDLVSLFHNEGNGKFTDVTSKQSMGFQSAVVEGMGADIADFDGDGDFDLYVSNSTHNDANPGSGFFPWNGSSFDSAAAAYGVLADFDWGTGWIDADNDGWPDILVVGNAPKSRFLYRNLGGMFEAQPQGLPTYPDDGDGLQCVTAVFADYDRDGKIDALLMRSNGTPPELLHNETAGAGNWLGLDVWGAKRRDAIGALVEVEAGGRVLRKQILNQTSKGSTSDRRLHFGVGSATTVDVTVVWPWGGMDRVTGVPVNGAISIEEGCSTGGAAWPAGCNMPPAPMNKTPVAVDPMPMPTPKSGCDTVPGGAPSSATGLLCVAALALLAARARRRAQG